MTFQAVLFDLFDTLVLFHRERLPEIHVNGRTVHSTAGHLHAAFRPFAPHVELPAFMDALFWSWQEAERIRSEAHREVSAPERFGMLFGRLELEPSVEARDLLLATHMRELSKVVECPGHHAPLLKALRERYRRRPAGPSSSARASPRSSRPSSSPTRSAGASPSRSSSRPRSTG